MPGASQDQGVFNCLAPRIPVQNPLTLSPKVETAKTQVIQFLPSDIWVDLAKKNIAAQAITAMRRLRFVSFINNHFP